MPAEHEINAERERLYESASLRDDLNDAEAEVLLKWGEGAVYRMATLFPAEFEQKCRFLRQLIKNINRFVGQREFNELDGQRQYLSKVLMYLPQLGWEGIDEAMLFAAMPEDRKDMMGTLMAILNILTPPAPATTDPAPAPAETATEVAPPVEESAAETPAESSTAPENEPSAPPVNEHPGFARMPWQDGMLLENDGDHSINQAAPDHSTGENTPYGEED